ncbi:MAG: UvrABC system protein [Pseudomonadota bacterium]
MLIRVLDQPLDRKSLTPLDGPGVYIFSNALPEVFQPILDHPAELLALLQDQIEVCYVGKAKRLNQRLKTYRSEGGAAAGDWYKANKLHERARSVLVISTPTHFEACLLELFLIRILDPQLNFMSTRPGKLFYVQQNSGKREVFATTRRMKGVKTWGCVRVKSELRAAFDVFNEILEFYDPTQDELKIRPVDSAGFRATRSRRYSLYVTEKHVFTVNQVLRGKKVGLLNSLWRSMRVAADEQQFHHAARLRDAYLALRQLQLQLIRSRKIMRRLRRNVFQVRDCGVDSGREYILSKYCIESVVSSGEQKISTSNDLFMGLMNSVIEIFKSQFKGENDLERLRVNFEFLRLMLWWLDNQPEECATRSAKNA